MALLASNVQTTAQGLVIAKLNAFLSPAHQLTSLSPEGKALVDGIIEAVVTAILTDGVVTGVCPPGAAGGPLTLGKIT